MQNIEFAIEKNRLTLQIDLNHILGPSASGKTLLVASTGGNVAIGPQGMKLGLNLYKPNPDFMPEDAPPAKPKRKRKAP